MNTTTRASYLDPVAERRFVQRARWAVVVVGGMALSCRGNDAPLPSDASAQAALPDAGSLPVPPRDAATSTAEVTVEAPSLCSADQWCWPRQFAPTNDLHDLAVATATDFWAVGDSGTILHWQEGRLTGEFLPGAESLYGVWASPQDGWAVGANSTILRRGADGWKRQPLERSEPVTFHAVWKEASGEVWVAGEQGVLVQGSGDPVSWVQVPVDTTETIYALWGTQQDAWAVGSEGLVLHRTGGAWQTVDSGTTRDLYAVHGAADSVWVAGESGEVRRYDPLEETWQVVVGEGIRPAGDLHSLQVVGPEEVYAVGALGQLYQWQGDKTCPVPGDAGAAVEPCPSWVEDRSVGQAQAVLALWSDGPSAIAVGEGGMVVRWEQRARTILSRGGQYNYLAGSALDSHRVWVAGDRLLTRTDDRWRAVDRDSVRAVYSVLAQAGDSALIAGTGGMARRYESEQWEALDVQADTWLRALSGDDTSSWLVGSRGRIFGLLNNSLWTELSTPTTADLLAAWTLPGGATWAVGQSGTILRHAGTSWALVPSGPVGAVSADLHGVWSSADDDVWAVGAGAMLLHYDGQRWSEPMVLDGVGAQSFNAVWGRSADDVWVVGEAGLILHFDGSQWQRQDSGTNHALNAVWGTASELFVAGARETLLVQQVEN